MEPTPQGISLSSYRVLWHDRVKADLKQIGPSEAERLIRAAEEKLARAPELIGQPLKGTARRLWKLRFGKYRVVYTLHPRTKEVQVLSIQTRDIIYRPAHLESLLKLAIALSQTSA